MELPARVGKYELIELLGGGMSHVYRARDTVIGRTVAVKILTEAGCQDAEAKARFLAEARMAGNISHDNIITIYDFGEDEKHHPFMVMEFLHGEDLHNAIKKGHTGDIHSKLRIAFQIARALEHIHTQKIVHRDLKPENIHVNGAGVVKLMDFGIAKTEGLAMTRAGYVLGTPSYMSPEQVLGQNITEQADVYAFGILLVELFTGAKPFAGDTVERIFYSILNEPLKLDPLYKAGVPRPVCDLVAKCANKSPADRPQGFAPICAELEQMISTPAAVTCSDVVSSTAPSPIELLDHLMEGFKKQCVGVGGKGRFPFSFVTIRIGMAESRLRASVGAVLFNRGCLAAEIRAMLQSTGLECPRPLRVDVKVVERDSIQNPTIGYDCAYSVQLPEPPMLKLTVRNGGTDGRSFELRERLICVGRSDEVRDNSGRLIRRNLVVVPDSAISRAHAHIQFDDEAVAYRLFDDGSRLETTIYREAGVFRVPSGLSGGAWLRSGDEVHFGPVQVRVDIAELPR